MTDCCCGKFNFSVCLFLQLNVIIYKTSKNQRSDSCDDGANFTWKECLPLISIVGRANSIRRHRLPENQNLQISHLLACSLALVNILHRSSGCCFLFQLLPCAINYVYCASGLKLGDSSSSSARFLFSLRSVMQSNWYMIDRKWEFIAAKALSGSWSASSACTLAQPVFVALAHCCCFARIKLC